MTGECVKRDCTKLYVNKDAQDGFSEYVQIFVIVSMVARKHLKQLTEHVSISDGYLFTTCSKVGPVGPNQTECDAAYADTNTTVLIGK